MKKIYMDYAATTYLKKEVLEAMYPFLTEEYANPSSAYSFASIPKMEVDKSRKIVADAINAKRDEIFFTAGGSEADNWAIIGTALANRESGNHIITTKIEHHAVLNSCKYLEKLGFKVTYLDVEEVGLVNINQLKEAICKDTILVSVMYANNEVGTIQPIKEIGDICREKNILFHTDAVQAVGNIKIDVEKENIDMLSMAAHKFYGPKGMGALYIRKGTKIDGYIHGGSQERGKRAGTINTAGIAGMGRAMEISMSNIEAETIRLSKYRDMLIEGLLQIRGSRLNGAEGDYRLPGNCNISFKNVEGDMLLAILDSCGIYASSGSACSAGSLEPSHVLEAMKVPKEYLKGSLRLTIGSGTTEDDINYVIEKVKEAIDRLNV
ncbi:MAG: cysteine desulfurase NifS [Solirubrobacterales bacterium]